MDLLLTADSVGATYDPASACKPILQTLSCRQDRTLEHQPAEDLKFFQTALLAIELALCSAAMAEHQKTVKAGENRAIGMLLPTCGLQAQV